MFINHIGWILNVQMSSNKDNQVCQLAAYSNWALLEIVIFNRRYRQRRNFFSTSTIYGFIIKNFSLSPLRMIEHFMRPNKNHSNYEYTRKFKFNFCTFSRIYFVNEIYAINTKSIICLSIAICGEAFAKTVFKKVFSVICYLRLY